MVASEDEKKLPKIEARRYSKAAQNTDEHRKPVQPRPTGWFPLGYKEGLDQWVYYIINAQKTLN